MEDGGNIMIHYPMSRWQPVPKMPENFKGKKGTKGKYIKNNPRKWTQEEINWCLNMKAKGYTIKQIAESVERGEVSVSIKMKRMTKKQDTYNEPHKEDKYLTNLSFYTDILPKSILDLFAGNKSWWELNCPMSKIITNDMNPKAHTEYHTDALKCICKLYAEGNKYDLIDLDPYGSAYDCFDLAIKMAKKGLIVTLGEMGHKRWRRLDYVRTHYGIEKFEDFRVERLVEEIQKIGERNKKHLRVWKLKEWRNIARVYFTIEPLKITEQWNG
jgi:hypothetical protein